MLGVLLLANGKQDLFQIFFQKVFSCYSNKKTRFLKGTADSCLVNRFSSRVTTDVLAAFPINALLD